MHLLTFLAFLTTPPIGLPNHPARPDSLQVIEEAWMVGGERQKKNIIRVLKRYEPALAHGFQTVLNPTTLTPKPIADDPGTRRFRRALSLAGVHYIAGRRGVARKILASIDVATAGMLEDDDGEYSASEATIAVAVHGQDDQMARRLARQHYEPLNALMAFRRVWAKPALTANHTQVYGLLKRVKALIPAKVDDKCAHDEAVSAAFAPLIYRLLQLGHRQAALNWGRYVRSYHWRYGTFARAALRSAEMGRIEEAIAFAHRIGPFADDIEECSCCREDWIDDAVLALAAVRAEERGLKAQATRLWAAVAPKDRPLYRSMAEAQRRSEKAEFVSP